jgi:hypothetical protein
MYKDDGRFLCFYCAEINGFKGRAEYALADMLGQPPAKIAKALYGDKIPTADLFMGFELQDWWSDDEDEFNLWDDGGTWGSDATFEQIETLRQLILLWKPAHATCAGILVTLETDGGELVVESGDPSPWDPEASTWGDDGTRVVLWQVRP